MPITSAQVSGMIGGQQAMFGNFASYSQQISPMQMGGMPTYSNPMQGAGAAFQPPAPPAFDELHTGMNVGASAVSAMGNIGVPALGAAATLGGMFLPGAAGAALRMTDPFSMGLGGFMRASGLRAGGAGVMSNLGRIASGGVGSIARAGFAGMGGAMAGAALPMALWGGASYVAGQATEGAQFQNQVHGILQNQFRFRNPSSTTGYGFDREGASQVSDLIRTMGHQDMMTSPQELLRVMKQGTNMGLFKTVQDVKEFKTRFTGMVSALKEISSAMSTTLEGAMPFLAEARRMGFWTPQDVAGRAVSVRSTALNTGLSVAQTQQMMTQGATMARSIGALGAHGALGMQRSLDVVGGSLRSGAVSEAMLSEATGGLMGQEAVQGMAGALQAGATRFARSRRARWLLASLGGKDFKGLDEGALGQLTSGRMTLGDIRGSAERNINREGRFNFVMNEEELRGQLLEKGPEAGIGFVKALVGGSLYGQGARDKYLTRRMFQRVLGLDARQADVAAQQARSMTQIMEQNMARGQADLDQQERNRDEIMNHSWEGYKRKFAQWWDSHIKDPIQKTGAEIAKGITNFWERSADKLWGRAPAGLRLRGYDSGMIRALQANVMGDHSLMGRTFASEQQMASITGNFGNLGAGGGQAFEAFRKLGVQTHLLGGDALKRGLSSGKFLDAGEYFRGTHYAMRADDVKQTQQRVAAAMGHLSSDTAQSLGFANYDVAQQMLGSAREEMGTGDYLRTMTGLRSAMGSNADPMALARRAVQEIRAGRLGGKGLKGLVGGDTDQAAFRLAAAQGGGLRQSRAGIDFSGLPDDVRMVMQRGGYAAEKALGDRTEAEAAKLGSLLGGDDVARYMPSQAGMLGALTARQFSGTGKAKIADDPKAAIMRLAQRDDAVGQTFKQITSLFSSSKPEDHKRAYDLMGQLSSGALGELTDGESAVLVELGDQRSPHRKDFIKSLGTMGTIQSWRNSLGAKEVLDRRSRRFATALAERGVTESVISAFDDIRQKGEKQGKLGGILRSILGGNLSQTDYWGKMRQITEIAAGADPKQINRAIAAISGMKGSEVFTTALGAAASGGQAVESLTGNLKQQSSAFSNVFAPIMGEGVSASELRTLREGKQGDIADLTKRLLGSSTGEFRKWGQQYIEAFRTKNESKLMELGVQGAEMQAISTYGTKDTKLGGWEAGMHAGRKGSTEGMHDELVHIRDLLKDIRDHSKTQGVGNIDEKPEAGR